MASPRIVICGAGLAGVAAAHHLAVVQGMEEVTLVEPGHPLSLTSDKSTEAYRNWWPGPDRAMTDFTTRSIDLMEAIARRTGNRINLNRRGYLYATADAAQIPLLEEAAQVAEAHGAGEARVRRTPGSRYQPSPERGFEGAPTGSDVITDSELIRRHFPYLSPDTVAVAHARRAGWLSAQQLGAVLLEEARARSVRLVRGEAVDIGQDGIRVRSVEVAGEDGRLTLPADRVLLAAGPMQNALARLVGVELPVYGEAHFKVSFPDTLGAVPRDAPMMIWLDEQHLPWTPEERDALAADPEAAWLLARFPAGVHGRPDGGSATIILFNGHGAATEPVFPMVEPDSYREVALRGMSTVVPALARYGGGVPRSHVDGGYYMRTQENRPLIGPAGPEGLVVSCAFSGFGVMGACAGGELAAAHLLGTALPDYAPAFAPSRYSDPAYRAALESWGDGGQL